MKNFSTKEDTQTVFNINDFINATKLDFKDISSEKKRIYKYADGFTIKINKPLWLYVNEKNNSHRIFDADGISHYIVSGWKHLKWITKKGCPHFIF
jgi:hypothetical protein